MSTTELEKHIFFFHEDYFDFIGADNETVQEFHQICKSTDLEKLTTKWEYLEKSFRKLEVEAGHRGRPLIMDYYLEHSYAITRLNRERRKSS